VAEDEEPKLRAAVKFIASLSYRVSRIVGAGNQGHVNVKLCHSLVREKLFGFADPAPQGSFVQSPLMLSRQRMQYFPCLG
jgi:hypothetical protein